MSRRVRRPQNRKLTSLLALTAGAVAAPEVADAGIVWSGNINQKVGFSAGFGPSFTVDLPGTANLRLYRPAPTYYQGVIFFQFGTGAYARLRTYITASFLFAKRNNAGVTWDVIGGGVQAGGGIGLRYASIIAGPGSFSDKYIAFMFQDSTQGDANRYGWALMSMTISGSPSPSGPDVTLQSWAYDDSGAKIAMGAGIPEPSSAALAALGALVLGSSGLRRWRSRKPSQP